MFEKSALASLSNSWLALRSPVLHCFGVVMPAFKVIESVIHFLNFSMDIWGQFDPIQMEKTLKPLTNVYYREMISFKMTTLLSQILISSKMSAHSVCFISCFLLKANTSGLDFLLNLLEGNLLTIWNELFEPFSGGSGSCLSLWVSVIGSRFFREGPLVSYQHYEWCPACRAIIPNFSLNPTWPPLKKIGLPCCLGSQ